MCGSGDRRRTASEPAGVDVGDQDRARTDLVEVVHQLLGCRRAAPSRARRPSPRDAAARRSAHSRPGVSATASSTRSAGHVVVHHHVAARHEDAVDAPLEAPRAGGRRRRPAGGSAPPRTRRIGSPTISSPAAAACCRSRRRRRSRRPRRAGSRSRRHRRGGRPRRSTPCVLEVPARPRPGTTSRSACPARSSSDVERRPAARRTGSVERPKPSGRISSALRAGVEQQVAAGDADVEGALADVHRDVARAQEEELDVVVRVEQVELLGVAALPVAGLAQHLGGGRRTASPCWGSRCAGASRSFMVALRGEV